MLAGNLSERSTDGVLVCEMQASDTLPVQNTGLVSMLLLATWLAVRFSGPTSHQH